MPPGEVWRPIVGADGLYEISSLGRVRSLDRIVGHRWGGTALKRGRVLNPTTRKRGKILQPAKQYVGLRVDGRSRQVRPARLVQQHFPELDTTTND